MEGRSRASSVIYLELTRNLHLSLSRQKAFVDVVVHSVISNRLTNSTGCGKIDLRWVLPAIPAPKRKRGNWFVDPVSTSTVCAVCWIPLGVDNGAEAGMLSARTSTDVEQ